MEEKHNLNEKYYLAMEPLTPVSIGAGAENDWVENVDFVTDTDKKYLYKFNLRKLMVDKGRIISDNMGKKSLFSAIGIKVLSDSNYAKRFKMPSDVDGNAVNIENPIKAIVKNNLTGNPVVPGSSLKGAIRSIIYKELKVNGADEQDVFGSAKRGDDFMRFFKISDAEFEKSKLINTKIFNLHKEGGDWIGGWKHKNGTNTDFSSSGFNTFYECIVPGCEGYLSIMISPLAYKQYGDKYHHLKDNEKRLFFGNGIISLFKIINKHTIEYLNKELAFFNKYNQAECVDEIIECIESLKQEIESISKDNPDSCILKMSAGSGFHSITGDWKFKDYSINGLDTSRSVSRGLLDGKKSAKSRKIADTDDGLKLMGFVRLTRIDENEYCQWNIISDGISKK